MKLLYIQSVAEEAPEHPTNTKLDFRGGQNVFENFIIGKSF